MLLSLYWSFFQIGLFSFGGGYAALPLIQEQVVAVHQWLTLTEFADVVTISQMTPGPIAINAASFIGTRLGGIGGAVAATLGCVTPSIIIVLTLAWLYFRYRNLKILQGILSGLRPAVVALIASAGVSLLLLALFSKTEGITSFADISWPALVLFIPAVLLLRKKKLSPIQMIILCGVISLLLSILGVWPKV